MCYDGWKLTEENLKQKYNDFHKNHIFLPYMKGREGKRKEGKRKGGGKKMRRERKGARQTRKRLLFPVCKKEGNSEVSANNVINWVSLN